MIAIFRTSPPTKENRRHGLTQFLVKMKQPGIEVNPIGQITGAIRIQRSRLHRPFRARRPRARRSRRRLEAGGPGELCL